MAAFVATLFFALVPKVLMAGTPEKRHSELYYDR